VVEAEIFDRRLERLEQTIADLRGIATMPAKALVADRALQAQAERWTQVAVEASIDLANHLIAARGWTTPATYRDAFRILAQHGVIDDAAAQKWPVGPDCATSSSISTSMSITCGCTRSW
jgi:uncharacterized protein YutE (UPF0331/DUF86 family)